MASALEVHYIGIKVSELRAFAENIFIVDGPPVRPFGVAFPTRMIIAKLEDSSLWVNSPVTVSDTMLERIRQLGIVRHLVAPTRLHVWRLEEWHGLFPEAALWAPPQIPRQFKKLPFAGGLTDEPPRVWADDFDQLVFRGKSVHRGSLFSTQKVTHGGVRRFYPKSPPIGREAAV